MPIIFTGPFMQPGPEPHAVENGDVAEIEPENENFL